MLKSELEIPIQLVDVVPEQVVRLAPRSGGDHWRHEVLIEFRNSIEMELSS
jgi:hypothetical protein